MAKIGVKAFLVIVFVVAFFVLLYPRFSPSDLVTGPYTVPLMTEREYYSPSRSEPAGPAQCSDRAPADSPTGDKIMPRSHPWNSHADVAERMWQALKTGACVPQTYWCGDRHVILLCPGLLYGKVGLFILDWSTLSTATGQWSLTTMYLVSDARAQGLVAGCTPGKAIESAIVARAVEVHLDDE